jgi:hypothetical protein
VPKTRIEQVRPLRSRDDHGPGARSLGGGRTASEGVPRCAVRSSRAQAATNGFAIFPAEIGQYQNTVRWKLEDHKCLRFNGLLVPTFAYANYPHKSLKAQTC